MSIMAVRARWLLFYRRGGGKVDASRYAGDSLLICWRGKREFRMAGTDCNLDHLPGGRRGALGGARLEERERGGEKKSWSFDV